MVVHLCSMGVKCLRADQANTCACDLFYLQYVWETFSVLYCSHLWIGGRAFVFCFNCLELSVRADT